MAQIDLAEELRKTMDATGWDAHAEIVIDTTAERLAGKDEAATEPIRKDLWREWRKTFTIPEA